MERRSCSAHRGRQILSEVTKTGMRKAESKFGVRYSLLLNLPYFDPVLQCVVDVMHNLFLGTGEARKKNTNIYCSKLSAN